MTTYVINREDAQKPVDIRNKTTGAKATIFVQPLSRAKIEEGYEVPPEFLAMNPKVQVKTGA